jgi:hypothetical protein
MNFNSSFKKNKIILQKRKTDLYKLIGGFFRKNYLNNIMSFLSFDIWKLFV